MSRSERRVAGAAAVSALPRSTTAWPRRAIALSRALLPLLESFHAVIAWSTRVRCVASCSPPQPLTRARTARSTAWSGSERRELPDCRTQSVMISGGVCPAAPLGRALITGPSGSASSKDACPGASGANRTSSEAGGTDRVPRDDCAGVGVAVVGGCSTGSGVCSTRAGICPESPGIGFSAPGTGLPVTGVGSTSSPTGLPTSDVGSTPPGTGLPVTGVGSTSSPTGLPTSGVGSTVSGVVLPSSGAGFGDACPPVPGSSRTGPLFVAWSDGAARVAPWIS
ncbi:hypothetical protein EES39_24660 [Streptomyces sp. ADI92-24]|nr:hypothetical protein EES39_24660 [Streptomyces sp. ADI92-24]